ncbi:hypothetical protein SODALDRAFT_359524 [Sodiomyces alkalinus F11]|uniref:Uncharacterized protein n=1 Tax=Sodiomyces alkalinus (strain CBS 110278 / VKM F-3762 / F11) TaxID=1314773 RepID=A0A3N2PVA9_SODAK|nr:hypothetical protein SODALDRAFT_359524 [Sodiomyces alkalinus F11]ROT38431.1 hypothetical protein SODALDRAFT_359524 [Sodiomyces alkalinus F11]
MANVHDDLAKARRDATDKIVSGLVWKAVDLLVVKGLLKTNGLGGRTVTIPPPPPGVRGPVRLEQQLMIGASRQDHPTLERHSINKNPAAFICHHPTVELTTSAGSLRHALGCDLDDGREFWIHWEVWGGDPEVPARLTGHIWLGMRIPHIWKAEARSLYDTMHSLSDRLPLRPPFYLLSLSDHLPLEVQPFCFEIMGRMDRNPTRIDHLTQPLPQLWLRSQTLKDNAGDRPQRDRPYGAAVKQLEVILGMAEFVKEVDQLGQGEGEDEGEDEDEDEVIHT